MEAVERRSGPEEQQGGERAAEKFLLRAGLHLLARGFRCRAGEIDLVLRDEDTLVFVEVKTRRPSSCGTPAEAVDRRKRRKLIRAAAFYLSGLRGRLPPCRFDVVEIVSRSSTKISAMRAVYQPWEVVSELT